MWPIMSNTWTRTIEDFGSTTVSSLFAKPSAKPRTADATIASSAPLEEEFFEESLDLFEESLDVVEELLDFAEEELLVSPPFPEEDDLSVLDEDVPVPDED